MFEPHVERFWPIGQNYLAGYANGTKSRRTWAEYKLGAAAWYLEALEQIFAVTGDLDRFVGVEMALDGCLAAASSAFDAACDGLIGAIETYRQTPVASQMPDYQKSWRKVQELADANPPIRLACRAAVDGALDGDRDAQPQGWLARARRLRNRTTHQDTLTRHFYRGAADDLGGGTPAAAPGVQPTRVGVPGLGEVDPLPYLRDFMTELAPLVNAILADADSLDP